MRANSMEWSVSSLGQSWTVILTRPRSVSDTLVSPELLKERVQGRWGLISVIRNKNGDVTTYVLDFHREDGPLELTVRCDE